VVAFTIERATWCRTPASVSASRRVSVTVPKNFFEAVPETAVVLTTSITPSTPSSAAGSPTPVSRSNPVDLLRMTGS
jgi:hypothetical protein